MQKKCTKIYNAHAQTLFFSLSILFGGVFVVVVVVDCLKFLFSPSGEPSITYLRGFQRQDKTSRSVTKSWLRSSQATLNINNIFPMCGLMSKVNSFHQLTFYLPRVTIDFTLCNAWRFYSVLCQTILLVRGRPLGSERVKELSLLTLSLPRVTW